MTIFEEVLTGTIIGDGCIFKGKLNINCRMNLAHSLKQKEYFMKKYEILKSVIKTDPKERTWIDKRTKKEYSEIRFQSKTSEEFTRLREYWYKNGKKIIPKNSLDVMGETCLAVKYFDDGYLTRGAYSISMNDYDEDSIKNFRLWLLDRFNINCSLHKKGVLYIKKNESYKLTPIISKFATQDVMYKVISCPV